MLRYVTLCYVMLRYVTLYYMSPEGRGGSGKIKERGPVPYQTAATGVTAGHSSDWPGTKTHENEWNKYMFLCRFGVINS